jgi:hypothetical protein
MAALFPSLAATAGVGAVPFTLFAVGVAPSRPHAARRMIDESNAVKNVRRMTRLRPRFRTPFVCSSAHHIPEKDKGNSHRERASSREAENISPRRMYFQTRPTLCCCE